ncbi:START domain-containing protein [Polluticoccus soli]|uniref:START domain-containing protein n=1 Tax=Polluticoccus soli TaxID=3034150 RepID=UPI0023E1A4DC|nr:START domain-containing protein [Flavipsychrobacter sp. JY13-12]
MKRILLLVSICYSMVSTAHQHNWELKKQDGALKIYTGTAEVSKVKALKVEYILNASLSTFAATLLDVEGQAAWVYSTKSSSLLKRVNDSEFIAYSEKVMPTPFSNRDLITKVHMHQDPATKVLTINVLGLPNYIPEKDGLVRVPMARARWTLTPISSNQVKVEYIAEAEPGGSIPAWVANLFLLKGPTESFKRLSAIVQQPKYRNATVSFIEN